MPVSLRGPVLVAVLMLTLCPPCTCGLQQDVGVLQVVKSDRVFSQGLLWTACRTSVVRCAAACLKDPLCVCFTFTNNSTGQAGCRGHSLEPRTEGEWSPGSRLYLLTSRSAMSSLTTQQEPATTTDDSIITTTANSGWLNKTCTDNWECVDVAANAECFNDRCMCTPGYYYSLTTGLCLSNCFAQNLQDVFLFYPGYMILNCELSDLPSTMSISDCLDFCVRSSITCPSVSITISNIDNSTTCRASHKSRLDVSPSN